MKRNRIYLAALASLLVLIISGCQGGTAPSETSVARATPILAVLNPDSSPSRVSKFQAKGDLNPVGAAFLAETKLEITSPNKDLYQFRATFPTNTPAEMNIRLTPNQKYTPTAAERAAGIKAYNVNLTHTITGDTYSLKLQYFLPNGVLPVASNTGTYKAVYQPLVLRSGSTSRIQPVVYHKNNSDYETRLLSEGGGEESGVMVTFEAMIEAAGKEFIAGIEANAWLKKGVEGAPIKTGVTSVMEVIEALGMTQDYQEYVNELDELQMEAEYPSNPLTQKAYAEDPGAKQQILDEIADTRTEMQWDTALAYMSSEISVALDLAESPILTVAVAPIVKWNKETAKELIEERIVNIRKMIARGPVNTDNPGQTTATPQNTATSTPTPTISVVDQDNPNAGLWTGTYQGTQKITYPGGTTINITDKGQFTFTVKNGEAEGTGNGHVVFHSQDPNGGYGDGQADYTFPITATVIGSKLELALVDMMPDPPIMSVVAVSRDGHKTTMQQPITAPLLKTNEPLDLEGNYTKKTNIDDNEGGMQITFTGTITLD